MTIDEMKQRKKELGLSNKKLAELAGVPEPTIQKLFSGKTSAPRQDTVQKLENVLCRKESSQPKSYTADLSKIPLRSHTPATMLKDAAFSYGFPGKKQGEYTLEDYLALPDERRVELIDGVFYDMASPTSIHQIIGGLIYKFLIDYALAHKGPCVPFMSPVDVQLDEDDRTVVVPDVIIVCDRKKIHDRIIGAPDFIVEVLSPSTRKRDMGLKLVKYSNAGVREYWMIDPRQKKIVVYDLEHDELPMVYSFQDKVPVLIWNSECVIDFAEIDEYTSFLYE